MTPPKTTPSGDLSMSARTWSIAEVQRDTGLGKDTLRVWERRYGFPAPLRDRLGERAYPHEQVQRLRLLKRLVDAGYRPGKVVPLSEQDLQALLQGDGEAVSGGVQALPATELSLLDAAPWLQWLTGDRSELIRPALQQQIMRHGLGTVVDRLVAPLCVLVGQAWLRGEVSIYQEHLLTGTLQSVLQEAIATVDDSGQSLQQSPRVLLTTTPGEQHGLGLLMVQCHFALESCVRFMLGTSTPIADIVQAARQLQIDVLALSFSAHTSRRGLVDSLQQLIEQLPPHVEIWVGGAAAAAHARVLPQGVIRMNQPGEVSIQVQSWRQRHVH